MQVVPLTSTIRDYRSEVVIEADDGNGLELTSAAQCQHARAIALQRLGGRIGSVGVSALLQMRAVLADLLDI